MAVDPATFEATIGTGSKVVEVVGRTRTAGTMAPAEVANRPVFGIRRHGSRLDGGDLLRDGGHTTTYE